MIVSASRRTDIPCYYSEWFCNRIKEGFYYVRNPMNAHQISKISLSPELVDCIVFWTKNPIPMLNRLDELRDYDYYFQFTLTGYDKDVEQNLPDKQEVMIPAFQKLSEKIGPQRVIWRYDPILINEKYTIQYHIEEFRKIAYRLKGYTRKAIISFVDLYEKTKRNMADLHMVELGEAQMKDLAGQIAQIARECGMVVESCAEKIDLESAGVKHGHCIDKELIEEITGCSMEGKRDGQREACGCLACEEMGTYNTCKNGCRYCYANFNQAAVKESVKSYDPNSSLLCGMVGPHDKITERKVKSLKRPKDNQMTLADYMKMT